MSGSTSKAPSLPSLRPHQVSPLAASRGRPTTFKASRLHPSSIKERDFHLKSATETQSLPKPTPTLKPIASKRKDVSTSVDPNTTRPSEVPRGPSRSFQEISSPIPSSPSRGHNPFVSAPTTSQPFFSLTRKELKTLRRSMGKGASYTQFRDITVARTLDRLGRGWDGYLRAKEMAGEKGKIDEFWRHASLELNNVLSTTRFRPGAISIEAAALAAQSNYTSSVGKIRPESAAEIRWMRAELCSNIVDSGLAGPDSDSCDSTIVWPTSRSSHVSGTDSQVRQRASPDPVPVSRPRRNLKRPDYRIPPLFESSPEPPPSPDVPSKTASPTPRQIYDRMQPKFIQYPCDWSGCKANLKNLETLQKHIRIVHTEEARDTLCCRWGNCGTAPPITYKSPEDLDKHFETSHLKPLRWLLGDGPKSHEVVAKVSGTCYPL